MLTWLQRYRLGGAPFFDLWRPRGPDLGSAQQSVCYERMKTGSIQFLSPWTC